MEVESTLKKLGAKNPVAEAGTADMAASILGGASVELANDWRLKSSRVAGEKRIEILGPDYRFDTELERHGVFIEEIGSKVRYFIPTGKDANTIIAAITKTRPVVGGGEPQFSPKSVQPEAVEFAPPAEDGPPPSLWQRLGNALGFGTARQTVEVPTWMDKSFNVYADVRAGGDRDESMRRHGVAEADYVRFQERVNRLSLDESGELLQAVERRNQEARPVAPPQEQPRAPVTDVEEIPAAEQEILFSPKRQVTTGANPNRVYSPEVIAANGQTGRTVDVASFREKMADATNDIVRKVLLNTVDSYIGLKRDSPAGYLAARMANSVAGAQEAFRKYATLRFNGATYDWQEKNGGVQAFVKGLGDEAHDFLWWVAGNRAERLTKEDRERLFTPESIAANKSLNEGTLATDYTLANGRTTRDRATAYNDALGRYEQLNKSVLDLVVESGLVSRKTIDAKWANPFYVPFFREAMEAGTTQLLGTPGFTEQYASKTLKGGSEKLRTDLWDNVLGNWDHMIDAALRNRASNTIADDAIRLGSARELNFKEYELLSRQERESAVWMMKDGEKRYVQIGDPMIYKAVTALETVARPGILMTAGRAVARGLRYGVTANPYFAVRNSIRDTQNALAVSQISANPLKNLVDGSRHIDFRGRLDGIIQAISNSERGTLHLTDEALSALAGGALMRLGTADDAGIKKTDLRNILDSPNKLQAFGRYIGGVADAYKDVLATAEDVNRLALYTQLRKQGVEHDFAAFSARDLQDFTLRGASPLVRTITELTPFLNARMQGLYKLGRSAAQADQNVALAVGSTVAINTAKRMAFVLGAMTMAGLALDGIYADDEDYKKRTEYDRQTYYWFKIGEAQFRIPKGFELAAISGIATDGIEMFFSKEMTGKRFAHNAMIAIGQNLQVQAPAFAQPIIDIATNTTHTGGPIETMAMQRLVPGARRTADTTLIARGASAAIGGFLSPVQLDHLVEAYGAWLGGHIVGIADMAVRGFADEPTKPDKDFWASWTQGLIRTNSGPQSRYVDMLYQQGSEIEQTYNTFRDMVRRGRHQEAREYRAENLETIRQYPRFEAAQRTETMLNNQIRVIEANRTMTGEEKKNRIAAIQARKNVVAQRVFNRPAPQPQP